jgi:transcriptional regulator with XRE-family HTH domain
VGEGGAPVRTYRRSWGVNMGDGMSTPKKSLKMLLTEKDEHSILPDAPVTAFPPKNVPTFLPYPHAGKHSQRGVPVSAQTEKPAMSSLEMDREVIRCKTCGLVQYRTRTGNCRRCVRALPQRLEFMIPAAEAQEEAAAEAQTDKFANQQTVENIGQRIRQLRESRSMTQSQLQSRSKVSRSYLSRIESGQMTPSLGTLEKISEALNVGLNRFFIPESDGEALLEDPFIQGLRPFLRQLDWEQWQSILKRLQAISDHVVAVPVNLRPIGNPARLPQPASGNGNGNGHLHASHSNGHALNHAHGHPQGYPLRRPAMPVYQRPLAR